MEGECRLWTSQGEVGLDVSSLGSLHSVGCLHQAKPWQGCEAESMHLKRPQDSETRAAPWEFIA